MTGPDGNGIERRTGSGSHREGGATTHHMPR
jgi:hypothetical protein